MLDQKWFCMGRTGGRGWIRTTEDAVGRFTVCSLWPLGNLSLWSWWSESNQQPTDYKSVALPVELHQRIYGAAGRDRTTDTGIFSPLLYLLSYRGIQVFFENACKNYKHFHLATRRGLEPLTSSVTGWRTNQLYYRATYLIWWAFTDSNRGPIGYEPTALTNWAKGPNHLWSI